MRWVFVLGAESQDLACFQYLEAWGVLLSSDRSPEAGVTHTGSDKLTHATPQGWDPRLHRTSQLGFYCCGETLRGYV